MQSGLDDSVHFTFVFLLLAALVRSRIQEVVNILPVAVNFVNNTFITRSLLLSRQASLRHHSWALSGCDY